MNELNIGTRNVEAQVIDGAQLPPDALEQARILLHNYPRELGYLAAQSANSDALLLGMMDGGIGLQELLEAAEMHGDLSDIVEQSEDQDRAIAIIDTEDGWVPGLLSGH